MSKKEHIYVDVLKTHLEKVYSISEVLYNIIIHKYLLAGKSLNLDLFLEFILKTLMIKSFGELGLDGPTRQNLRLRDC